MSAEIKASSLYWIAGASLVGAWCAPQLLGSPPTLYALRNVGWAMWTFAIALIWVSLLSSRSKGKTQQRKEGPCASLTLGGGIYVVIRHPRYLGWLLVYVAVMMLIQHWIAVVCAVPGMVCVYLISMREDLRLIKELGPAYEQYMRCVPALNLITGLTRFLRRKAEGRINLSK